MGYRGRSSYGVGLLYWNGKKWGDAQWGGEDPVLARAVFSALREQVEFLNDNGAKCFRTDLYFKVEIEVPSGDSWSSVESFKVDGSNHWDWRNNLDSRRGHKAACLGILRLLPGLRSGKDLVRERLEIAAWVNKRLVLSDFNPDNGAEILTTPPDGEK